MLQVALLDEVLTVAQTLCRLRHPNLLSLYGLVIPDHLVHLIDPTFKPPATALPAGTAAAMAAAMQAVPFPGYTTQAVMAGTAPAGFGTGAAAGWQGTAGSSNNSAGSSMCSAHGSPRKRGLGVQFMPGSEAPPGSITIPDEPAEWSSPIESPPPRSPFTPAAGQANTAAVGSGSPRRRHECTHGSPAAFGRGGSRSLAMVPEESIGSSSCIAGTGQSGEGLAQPALQGLHAVHDGAASSSPWRGEEEEAISDGGASAQQLHIARQLRDVLAIRTSPSTADDAVFSPPETPTATAAEGRTSGGAEPGAVQTHGSQMQDAAASQLLAQRRRRRSSHLTGAAPAGPQAQDFNDDVLFETAADLFDLSALMLAGGSAGGVGVGVGGISARMVEDLLLNSRADHIDPSAAPFEEQ